MYNNFGNTFIHFYTVYFIEKRLPSVVLLVLFEREIHVYRFMLPVFNAKTFILVIAIEKLYPLSTGKNKINGTLRCFFEQKTSL